MPVPTLRDANACPDPSGCQWVAVGSSQAKIGFLLFVAESAYEAFLALCSLSPLFNSTPTGLWFLVDAFIVWRFDPFRVTLSLLRIVLILTQKRLIQSRVFYFRMPRFRIRTLNIDDKIVVVSIVSELSCNQCIR
jgi:hypothetical protein